jgi:hypothetical protein
MLAAQIVYTAESKLLILVDHMVMLLLELFILLRRNVDVDESYVDAAARIVYDC